MTLKKFAESLHEVAIRAIANDKILEFRSKLISDPLCGILFLDPVECGSELDNAAYHHIVGRPMDVTQIQNFLKDRGDSSLQS
jgi:hypothetical protein